MLSEYLTPDVIQVQISVSSWNEAVKVAGNMLVKAGKCKPSYVQAMIAAVHEMGPYMVLAPGLALAHARPEDGVLESGLSVLTLNPPIEFGSKSNDPVSLLFAFGGADDGSHIGMLAELADLLGEQDRCDQLSTATEIDQVLDIIRKFEQSPTAR